MSKPYTVSGPVNCVRLEGVVFGIKKVLYVFFDVHKECYAESRCADIFSDNIITYFKKQFDNIESDRTIDFFVETSPKSILKTNNKRGKYIDKLDIKCRNE